MVVLKDVEGLKNEEIAETLGISVPAVKSRLHRGRLILRQLLSEYFSKYTEPSGEEKMNCKLCFSPSGVHQGSTFEELIVRSGP